MQVLAFDFGASSGRAMLGRFDGTAISLEEIHRFSNDPVRMNGTLYWDAPRLFFEIKEGIRKARSKGGFDAIGIDTWGVDFALLDKAGDLIANPVHYRDSRTEGMMEETFRLVPREEMYQRTGSQFMRINTVFQLLSLAKKRPDLLERAESLLLVPDFFSYLLTGEKKAEYTEASTTQMLDPYTGDWDRELLKRLGLPVHILPEIILPGTVYGTLTADLAEELGVARVPVIAVASHDTASAVAATPAQEKDFLYISCGTWSLFGTELDAPVINEKTQRFNLTNEGGYGRTITLLRNIMGLWLIQESRRQWLREGFDVTYASLEQEALAEAPFVSFVDPDAPEFEAPGNLPERIRAFCRKTGQSVPENRGQIMRCVYESLALKYRCSLEMLRETTGKDYPTIHVVGGGTKDGFLCQLAADACGIPVTAGPIEATVLGNIAVQLIALGAIPSVAEARKIIAASSEFRRFEPHSSPTWEDAYRRFRQLLS